MFDVLIYRILDKVETTCGKIREWLINRHYLILASLLVNGEKIMKSGRKTLLNNNDPDNIGNTNTTNIKI